MLATTSADALTGVSTALMTEVDDSQPELRGYFPTDLPLRGRLDRTSEVARAHGARDQRGVSVHRESLIGKGLIWSPRRGQLGLTLPLLAEYLRGDFPIASFEEA